MSLNNKVYIVSDDIIDNLDKVFKDYECFFYKDKQSIINEIKGNKPDLIVISYKFSDLIDEIKSDNILAYVPVILLLDSSEIYKREEWINKGISDYIIIPVQVNDAIAVVRRQFYLLELKVSLEESRKKLEKKQKELCENSIIDKLTGVLNRQYILRSTAKEFSKSTRYYSNISCIMFDVDNFRKINELYGYHVGEFILKHVARDVSKLLRKEDHFGRYWGEEFMVVLPETEKSDALLVAEKIRKKIESVQYKYQGNNFSLTLSVGVTDIVNCDTSEMLINNADLALYVAKNGGGNQTILFSDEL